MKISFLVFVAGVDTVAFCNVLAASPAFGVLGATNVLGHLRILGMLPLFSSHKHL